MSAELVTLVKGLSERLDKRDKDMETLQKNQAALVDKWSKTPALNAEEKAFGTPWARKGEDPFTSRGLSFLKIIGLVSGALGQEEAKEEFNTSARLHKSFAGEYTHGGAGLENGLGGRGRFLMPLAPNYFDYKHVDGAFRHEMKQMLDAGAGGADRDEALYMRRKSLERTYGTKALSWLNELTGGALVAPPEMGELIELLRNKEALVNAGARTVPLPPQGRMKFPRQTAASSTYWVGENAPITESLVGTGEITMQAKKLAVLIKAPNELVRFASPAAEALLRDDMTKSLALGLDLAGLEGQGGDTRPRGIIRMPLINSVSSSQQTANGDKIVGEDVYRMIAVVEENNAEFEGFIMRPKTLYKYYQLRADAVGQGDKQGMFLFNLIREAGDGFEKTMLGGFPVTKSTQISQVQSKGTASNLTYIVGGMWSDLLIGMFGAIEFAATTLGDTAFVNDQTWVRGILSADIMARHEVAFCLMDNLGTTL